MANETLTRPFPELILTELGTYRQVTPQLRQDQLSRAAIFRGRAECPSPAGTWADFVNYAE
jgi:hypothetical protein